MIADCLIGLAWIAIVFLPAIVAYRQNLVPHNGYIDKYMDAEGEDPAVSKETAKSSTNL